MQQSRWATQSAGPAILSQLNHHFGGDPMHPILLAASIALMFFTPGIVAIRTDVDGKQQS